MLKDLLTGQLVRLTRMTEADTDALLTWFDNEHFSRNIDSRPMFVESKKSIEERVKEAESKNSLFVFGIRTLEENTLVGLVELGDIQWNHGNGWLAIGIAPESQGRGYGRDAMQCIIRFGFEELNLHRVQLTVFEHNPNAIKLYESLGFQREGAWREFLHRQGQRYDMYLYGLLRREWVGNSSEN
jgi:RimJ/RimL family protein N-acetyltransferase